MSNNATKGVFTASKEYQSFRTSIALKRESIDHNGETKVWTIYDYGPREVRCPLIMLPPVAGTAEVFYKQLLSLGAAGFRVMAVDYPVYWKHEDWCIGFMKLLDQLHLDRVHLYGASLGGFLAQKFAEHTTTSRRVHSLILSGAFIDTTAFSKYPNHMLYKWAPTFTMKSVLLKHLPRKSVEAEVANSIDFIVEMLDKVKREVMASRLTLTTLPGYVAPQDINSQEIKIMVLEAMDQQGIDLHVQEELLKCYPEAKIAQIKDGGEFPFLSRDQEVNMYIKVHLRGYSGTRFTAGEDYDWNKHKNENSQ